MKTKDWRKSAKADELREYIDKVFKPKKPTMGGLDREIIIDFIAKEVSQAATAKDEAVMEAAVMEANIESIKIIEDLAKKYRGEIISEARNNLLTALKSVLGEKRELLAELEHEQWIVWSKDIAATEDIKSKRAMRWEKLWRPYSELTESEKDQDREWADKAIAILHDRITRFIKEQEEL